MPRRSEVTLDADPGDQTDLDLDYLTALGGALKNLAMRIDVAGSLLVEHPEKLVEPETLLAWLSQEHSKLSKLDAELRAAVRSSNQSTAAATPVASSTIH